MILERRTYLLKPLRNDAVLADAAIMKGLGEICSSRNPDLVVFGDERIYQGAAEWCRRKNVYTEDMLGKGSLQILENRILEGVYSNQSVLVYVPLPREQENLEDFARKLKEYEISAEVRAI
jgi:hypothetical protein